MTEEERYQELMQFLGEYSEKTETESLPVYCDNVVVNSVLGYYSLKAREVGIPFHCAFSIPKHLAMSDSDLCIVLGNALENAIEACGTMENPNAGFIAAEARVMDNQLLIKIENAYNGCLNLRDGEYASTKDEKSRGFGIQNIRRVVDAYRGFIKIEHTEKVFTLMAAIPCARD